ncbi:MAG: ABC transporter substrate-binding protein [Acidimicrobiales bacterium]
MRYPSASLTSPVPRPTIRMPGAGDVGYPTPFAYVGVAGFTLMSYVYDALLQEDTTGAMLPLLAARYERSPDGLTYLFELRDGPRWHDGLPVTADDVVFTFEYFGSQPLSPQLVAGPTDVVEARATGPRTVEVRLDKPAVRFESQVAGQLPILPRHVWSGTADPAGARSLEAAVGSGPYRLGEQTAGAGTFVLTANDDYYLGRPFVKRVELRPVGDTDLDAVTAGEVDIAAADPFGVPEALLVRYRDDPAYGVLASKAAGCVPLMWNATRGGALADPVLRHACVRAIDLDDVVTRVTGGNGVVGNAGYVVPGNPFYVDVPQPGTDPSAANRMLDEAGYTRSGPDAVRQAPDGAPLRYALTVVRGMPAVAELVTGSLRRVGVDVTPSQVSRADVVAGADYEMLLGFDNAVAEHTDPDQLRPVYDSASTSFRRPDGYANPLVDELVRRQAVTLDAVERTRLVAELQNVVARDLPVMPLYYPDQFSIFRRSVFDQWSTRADALTERKRNFLTGLKAGLTIRPESG